MGDVYANEQSLPEDGIKVFASQLHTHLTGRRAYTKHYRNGIELPELNRDNHYSPHYQEIRKLPRQVHVLPVSYLSVRSRSHNLELSCMHDDRNFIDRMLFKAYHTV